MERILWIADQYCCIINAIEASYIPIDIKDLIANGHEADIGIRLPYMNRKFADLLHNLHFESGLVVHDDGVIKD